jgi:hypothetical protein
MAEPVTTDQLKQELSNFYKTFDQFRKQQCKAEDATQLLQIIEVFSSLKRHMEIAYEHCAVLKSVSHRLGKVLMVCSSSSTGPTNGWESHIDFTWRADSKVGQKAVRKSLLATKTNVAFLYDPETDTTTDVTEIIKNSEEFVYFS